MQVNIDLILKISKKLLFKDGIKTASTMRMWLHIQQLFKDVLPEYEDREYHNLIHIYQGLQFFVKIANKIELRKEVILAWVLHDVLASEKETAKLVKALLKEYDIFEYLDSIDIITACISATGFYIDKENVEKELTQYNSEFVKYEAANAFNLIALADLQILWQNDFKVYHQYAHAVKKEVMKSLSISEDEFIKGRIQFLTEYIRNGFFPKIDDSLESCFSEKIDVETQMKQHMLDEIKQYKAVDVNCD